MISTEPAEAYGSLIFVRVITAASDIDGLPSQREIQIERGAFARPTLDANLARMLLDDAVGNREAQAGTPVLALANCGFSSEERIVNPIDVFGSNAAARIRDGNRNAGAIRSDHPQRAARRHRIFGVQEQVQKHLLQAPGIALDERQLTREFVLYGHMRRA